MLSALAPTQTNHQTLISRKVLANSRIIERYDNGITIVQDPNVNIENDDERLALLAELQAQAAPPPVNLDLNSVNERLRDLSNRSNQPSTPSEASTIPPSPLDDDRLLQIKIDQENRCRADLIKDGCPPCHPPEYTVPFDTEARIPRQHPAAMYYLDRSSSFHLVPLNSQLLEWRGFRRFQKGKRDNFQKHHDPEHTLREWMKDGRYVLRRYGYPEAAPLIAWSLDSENQSPLQNWIEFQVWHLLNVKAQRAEAQRLVTVAVSEQDRLWRQNFEDNRLKLHEALLVWIEQQRVAVATAETEKEPGQSGSPSAADATVASPFSKLRRSGRILTKTAATACVEQAASPATTALSRTRGRTRVAKRPVPSTTLRPTQHKTPRTAKAQDDQPHLQGADCKTAIRPRDIVQAARSKVAKQQQHQAATLPVSTRSGRLIRRPARFSAL